MQPYLIAMMIKIAKGGMISSNVVPMGRRIW